MDTNKKRSASFKRSLSVGLAFVLVAIIAGVYFLFKPFPVEPGLGVKANAPAAASVAGFSIYANAGNQVDLEALRYPVHRNYVDLEALRYPLHRNPVDIEALRYPMHQK